MSIKSYIGDGEGSNGTAGVRHTDTHGDGLKTYTYNGVNREYNGAPFVNPTYGLDMNQNATIGGTPQGVYNGGDDVYWTASIVANNPNDFELESTNQAHSPTRSLSAIGSENNDIVQFDKGSYVTHGDYVAVSGWVYLTGYGNVNNKGINIFMYDTNTTSTIGTEINIGDFITTSSFNVWQKFIISFSTLGISADFDAVRIRTVDTGGGPPPNYYIDDLQLEESGTLLEYSVQPDSGEIWKVHSSQMTIVDNYSGVVPDGTMQGIPYDGLLSLPTLINGLTIQRTQNDVINLSITINDFIDLMTFPTEKKVVSGSDGTKTWVTITLNFHEPLYLVGDRHDTFVVHVADDLSGLTLLRMSIGYSEVVNID
jgi:hypothetical protein|tara:strand:+ start:2597 stop:3703 length:1107 start_codon:yes stop_codon:yes gene_type:complete